MLIAQQENGLARNERGATEAAPQIQLILVEWLISLRALGHEANLLSDCEHKVGTRFEIGLRMADQKMGCDYARANDAAGKHADGAAENCANDHAAATNTSVFQSVLLEARAGGDHAF
jgi:hypothetical protein